MKIPSPYFNLALLAILTAGALLIGVAMLPGCSNPAMAQVTKELPDD